MGGVLQRGVRAGWAGGAGGRGLGGGAGSLVERRRLKRRRRACASSPGASSTARPGAPPLPLPQVSVNHFDADALLSMWSYMNREAALRHEPGARVGRAGSWAQRAGAGCWIGCCRLRGAHACLTPHTPFLSGYSCPRLLLQAALSPPGLHTPKLLACPPARPPARPLPQCCATPRGWEISGRRRWGAGRWRARPWPGTAWARRSRQTRP